MLSYLLALALTTVAAFPISADLTSLQSLGTDAIGTHGAVSCEVAQCSQIGVDLLKQGGSSTDAAIGATLCVEVMHPYHSGLGGGGFAVVRSKSDSTWRTETIDFRETMPAAGNETMYSNNSNPTASTIGGLSVGVPGHLKGLGLLHERHGKLPWAQIFEPSIKLADEGFEVTDQLADSLNGLFRETYAPNGTTAKLGQIVRRPRLARTYRHIAQNGIGDFYNGSIARNIVNAVQSSGGILNRNDLADYQPIIRAPVSVKYGNYSLYSVPAPASGAVTLSALKIFSHFDPTELADRNLSLHRLIQSTRFAYGQRTNYGDPFFVQNVTLLQQEYLSDDVTTDLQRRITDRD